MDSLLNNRFLQFSVLLNLFFFVTAMFYWINYSSVKNKGDTIEYNPQEIYYPNQINSEGTFIFDKNKDYIVDLDYLDFDTTSKTKTVNISID